MTERILRIPYDSSSPVVIKDYCMHRSGSKEISVVSAQLLITTTNERKA
jgi:hypothetical protein